MCRTRLLAFLLSLLVLSSPAAGEPEVDTGEPATHQFTFSWMFTADDAMAPRGGTTTGADLTLVKEPGAAWQALREPGLSARERDRRAILAMAGPWRASFDFIETAGFVPDYAPARPYRSWGTEYVHVVEDRPDFVSLQHVIVMFMKGENGTVRGPFVVKHWRQDWTFEGTGFHEFEGHRRWSRTTLEPDEVEGAWVQTVWQVDDSPRYASVGRWDHEADVSIWEGSRTLRPLPRREFSIRDDYDALRAVNRHIITPTGWVHEESNEKLVLDETPHVLAREAGLNRYERITDHDFSAGDAYWERTGPFWSVVREAWADLWAEQNSFLFEANVRGSLFMKLFARAETVAEADSFDEVAERRFVDETLAVHVTAAPDG
jgi:hypothetical protein